MLRNGHPQPDLSLNSKEVAELLRPYRIPDNVTNIRWLLLEYASIAVVLSTALGFYLLRESWGLSWHWNVPVSAIAIVLVGALQHRLAGLAHEGAHYCLFRHRLLNELASDLLCMFPVFATTHQYRLVHMAHHQYVNDWERDPDLTNIGDSKLMHAFPMTRPQFLYNYFLRFLSPPALFRYLWDVLSLSVLGQGKSPYIMKKAARQQVTVFGVRLLSLLGIGYFAALIGSLMAVNHLLNAQWWMLAVTAMTACMVAITTIRLLPGRLFFQSPLVSVYSAKATAALRVGYYTLGLTLFALARHWTGINFGGYFLLLWVVPLMTTFSYFMLLRDVFQHANADDGRLTNTRVFHCDPFTWWAVFVYGQGMHSPHHLFPAIPHYNLRAVHELLKTRCKEYAANVVECDGTFFNHTGKPTVIDVLATQPIVHTHHHTAREVAKV